MSRGGGQSPVTRKRPATLPHASGRPRCHTQAACDPATRKRPATLSHASGLRPAARGGQRLGRHRPQGREPIWLDARGTAPAADVPNHVLVSRLTMHPAGVYLQVSVREVRRLLATRRVEPTSRACGRKRGSRAAWLARSRHRRSRPASPARSPRIVTILPNVHPWSRKSVPDVGPHRDRPAQPPTARSRRHPARSSRTIQGGSVPGGYSERRAACLAGRARPARADIRFPRRTSRRVRVGGPRAGSAVTVPRPASAGVAGTRPGGTHEGPVLRTAPRPSPAVPPPGGRCRPTMSPTPASRDARRTRSAWPRGPGRRSRPRPGS